MKLYLVRHATAAELGGAIRTDAGRPLIDEGKKETHMVAMALRKLGSKGDAFVTSPLIRARQTAEIFAEVFDAKGKLHFSDHLAPGGRVTDLFKQLSELSRANEIFLFGHQPDMTHLAQSLLWTGPDFDMPFKKAGVCRIDVSDMPPTTAGRLKWFITPKVAHQMWCEKH